jgi:hypothetical protein
MYRRVRVTGLSGVSLSWLLDEDGGVGPVLGAGVQTGHAQGNQTQPGLQRGSGRAGG